MPLSEFLDIPGHPIFASHTLGSMWELQTTKPCMWIPLDIDRNSSDQQFLITAIKYVQSVQFSLVSQSRPTLCDPMKHGIPGLPAHLHLLEFTQPHVHRVGDAIQPSYPLSSPSPPAFNLSQHQGLFKWVSSSHQMAKVLEFQLQHQSFQWTLRTDLL